MAEKFLQLDLVSDFPKQREGLVQSTGAASAGRVIATDASGLLDASLLPTGLGPDVQIIQASEVIGEGDIVSLHAVSGAPRVRRALAVDDTKRPHGFVLIAGQAGENVTVYLGGKNTKIANTGGTTFAVSDIGKKVFLSPSQAGKVTLTPPTSAGQLYVPIGDIVEVTGAAWFLADPMKQT